MALELAIGAEFALFAFSEAKLASKAVEADALAVTVASTTILAKALLGTVRTVTIRGALLFTPYAFEA